jgi:hypothetical protein
MSTTDDLVRDLRGHHRGTMMADEVAHRVRFVVDPRDGGVAMPVSIGMLEAEQHVLFLPEEDEASLQLLLDPKPIDRDDEVADRWRIYHGAEEEMRWAKFVIRSGKRGAVVVDGDELARPNPLRAAEPGVCKRMNADPAALVALCLKFTGVETTKPVFVGVDPLGGDVRGRFDILRIWFPHAAGTGEEALAMLQAMVQEARAEQAGGSGTRK